MKHVTIYALALVTFLITSAFAAEPNIDINLTGEIHQYRDCAMNFGNRGGEIIFVNVKGLPQEHMPKDTYALAFPKSRGKIQWYENGKAIEEEYFDGGYWLPEKIWEWKDNCVDTIYKVRIIKNGEIIRIYVSDMKS